MNKIIDILKKKNIHKNRKKFKLRLKNIYIIYKLFLICLLCVALVFINYPHKEIQIANLYIVAHKDFANNIMFNPSYKILCDEKSQLKKEYKLEIIETYQNNILYPKRRGYGECSKIYPIWKLYKKGKLDSKYVGLFHYSRIFPFKNDISELDKIFSKYDVIIRMRAQLPMTTRKRYKRYHIVQYLDASIDIIKEKYPEFTIYANYFARKRWIHYGNIFIMKQKDFIKWGDFVFGVLLEFDKKYNLTSDEDTEKLILDEKIRSHRNFNVKFQSRLQGYLIERISNIFYDKYFIKRYEINTVKI